MADPIRIFLSMLPSPLEELNAECANLSLDRLRNRALLSRAVGRREQSVKGSFGRQLRLLEIVTNFS